MNDLLSMDLTQPGSNIIRHTYVHDPPILTCLSATVDIVVRCSGSLSDLVELYLQHSGSALSCWLRALNLKGQDEESFGLALNEPGERNEGLLSGVKTITEILGSLSDKNDFALHRCPIVRIHEAFVRIAGRKRTRTKTCSNTILALTGR